MGETHITDNDIVMVENTETADTKARTGVRECDVGITEYISDHEGFIGVVKSRYSDFHVNEIDKLGNELHLTDLTVPKPSAEVRDPEMMKAAKASLVELLKQEAIDEITNLAASNEQPKGGLIPHVDIDVSAMDKETRTQVHTLMKQAFSPKLLASTISKEETDENGKEKAKGEGTTKKYIRVQKANGRRESRRWSFPGEYVHFLVYKENKDTNEIASVIADRLNMHPSCVHYSGTKDKRAITTQKFCIKKRMPSQIVATVRHLKVVRLGNFEFSNEILKLGDLQGNRFNIALRKVKADRDTVEQALENIKEHGFINYFGMQRFGNCPEAPTHMIGMAILKADYKAACELILMPRANDKPHMRKIRQHWWDSRDAESTLMLYIGKHRTIERKLLEGLKRMGDNNFANAMTRLPRNIILMYLHAFQSLLFNSIASRRIKEFGLQLIPGDLVYRNRNDGDQDIDYGLELPLEADDMPGPSTSKAAPSGDAAATATTVESSHYRNKVKALTEVDIASGDYTIFDLVLPLPGHDVKFPDNMVGQWYLDMLAEHDLSVSSFMHRVKSYSLGGAYRKVLVLPKNVRWQWSRYDNHEGVLIASDWERLMAAGRKQLPDGAADTKGNFQALILQFTLPSSAYATMLLRELLKDDTSTASQIELEQREVQKIKDDDLEMEADETDLNFGEEFISVKNDDNTATVATKRKLDDVDNKVAVIKKVKKTESDAGGDDEATEEPGKDVEADVAVKPDVTESEEAQTAEQQEEKAE